MKGLVVSGILFVITVLFCACSGWLLENNGEKTVSSIENIQKNVSEENWEKALEETDKLKVNWEKDVKWITILIDHRETDEINQTLSSLREYVIYRETPELMATASALKQMFEHIPLKERLITENIF